MLLRHRAPSCSSWNHDYSTENRAWTPAQGRDPKLSVGFAAFEQQNGQDAQGAARQGFPAVQSPTARCPAQSPRSSQPHSPVSSPTGRCPARIPAAPSPVPRTHRQAALLALPSRRRRGARALRREAERIIAAALGAQHGCAGRGEAGPMARLGSARLGRQGWREGECGRSRLAAPPLSPPPLRARGRGSPRRGTVAPRAGVARVSCHGIVVSHPPPGRGQESWCHMGWHFALLGTRSGTGMVSSTAGDSDGGSSCLSVE